MEDKKRDVIDTVQVALRIRPLIESETARGCEECLQVIPGEPQVQVKDLAFTYNHVFPPAIGQQEFYERAVKNLVNMLFQGYNVTILAYGQTGSGKTYSMGTNYSGSEGDNNNLGIIPQAVADIFDYTDLHDSEFKFKIWVSFMELYQEQCYDLLSQKSRNHRIVEIREDHRGVILPGLTEQEVANSAETMSCLMRGSEGRAVGATAMNSMSSRSHAVFTIHISKESKQDKNQATMSKFHMVDLAGSERTKKTKATGDRLKEGIKINQGLLALGNVISALGDSTNRGYICYRESKLTRLLQDSLGGNSLTLMIACVSPADYNLEETVSTLRYADRARQIRNKPIVNQDAKAAEIVRLNNLVSELRLQLIGQGGSFPTDNLELVKQLEQERAKCNEFREKHKLLTNMLHITLAENTNLCEKALLADAAKEKFERKLNELAEKWNQTILTMNSTLESCDDKSLHKENIIDYFKDMKSNLEELQSVQVKCNEQLMEHDIRSVSTHRKDDDVQDMNGEENEETHDVMDREGSDEANSIFRHEALAMDQVALNKELQELNQAMALKMSVVNQITSNTKELVTYNENLEENKAKIVNLEKEKSELLQQLKHVQTKTRSDASVEERRRKVQQLENEIQDLKKKCQQQANLIKMKEKNEAKIQALNKEIQNMKAAKVSLVKRMRTESEKFRKWKMENDRNLCRMKAEDRKKQTTIARMETMHAKQQNVMKRKMEEAVAINKRLKDALEKQKIAQAKRGKTNNNKGDHVQQWLEQELEVLLSTLDAERTLEELMEDRSLLTAQLDQLRTDVENSEKNQDKIEQLTDELMLRKAQISDLQQKILSADQENKARTMWDQLHTMQETKTALKHLLETLIESKRGQQRRAARHAVLEVKHEQLKEAYDELNELYETSKKKYETQLSVLDMQQEEKISQLIRLGRGVNYVGDGSEALQHLQQRLNLQDQELDRLLAEKVKLAAEVEMLKNQLSELTKRTPEKRLHGPRKQKAASAPSMNHTFHDSSSDDMDDNEDQDPNWRATPLHKRQQVQRSGVTMNFTLPGGATMGDTNSTYCYDITDIPSANVTVRNKGVKRSSDGQTRCACRGSCASKHCSCKKANKLCGDSCKCQRTLCKNQTFPTDSLLENNKENEPNQTISNKLSDEGSLTNSINECPLQLAAKKDSYGSKWLYALIALELCLSTISPSNDVFTHGFGYARGNIVTLLYRCVNKQKRMGYAAHKEETALLLPPRVGCPDNANGVRDQQWV